MAQDTVEKGNEVTSLSDIRNAESASSLEPSEADSVAGLHEQLETREEGPLGALDETDEVETHKPEETPSETPEETPAETKAGEEEPPTPEEPPAELTVEDLKKDFETYKEKSEKTASRLKLALKKVNEDKIRAEGQIDEFNKVIGEIVKGKEQEPETPVEEELPTEFEVDVDRETGRAFVKAEDVEAYFGKKYADLNKAEIQELKDEISQLKGVTATTAATNAAERRLQNLLGRDEAYPQAYNSVKNQFAELDGMLTEACQENGVDFPQNVFEAIALTNTLGVSESFMQKYPNMDPVLLLESFCIPDPNYQEIKLTQALNAAKGPGTPTPPTEEQPPSLNPVDNLKKLSEKPSNLSNVQNQNTGTADSTLDRFQDSRQNLTAIRNFSRGDIDKVVAALGRRNV